MDHNLHHNPYEQGLARTPANHLPLTPLGFLDRSAQVHPEGIAVVHADDSFGREHGLSVEDVARAAELAGPHWQRRTRRGSLPCTPNVG